MPRRVPAVARPNPLEPKRNQKPQLTSRDFHLSQERTPVCLVPSAWQTCSLSSKPGWEPNVSSRCAKGAQSSPEIHFPLEPGATILRRRASFEHTPRRDFL